MISTRRRFYATTANLAQDEKKKDFLLLRAVEQFVVFERENDFVIIVVEVVDDCRLFEVCNATAKVVFDVLKRFSFCFRKVHVEEDCSCKGKCQ